MKHFPYQVNADDSSGSKDGAVYHTVRHQKGQEVDLHHIHDFPVKRICLTGQHSGPVLIPFKQLKRGQPPDTFQVITGQVLQ